MEEQDELVIWHVRQENIHAVMETEVFCRKKDMLFVNYEAPDGSKKHNRLWNGGNGWGTVKLYDKNDSGLELVSGDKEKTVAYLHDILEDTDYPEEKLRVEFGDEITDAVALLTHKERMNEEQYLDYIKRLSSSGNELAIAVKKADLTNNSDFTRLDASCPEELSEKDVKRWLKYQKALELLGGKRYFQSSISKAE